MELWMTLEKLQEKMEFNESLTSIQWMKLHHECNVSHCSTVTTMHRQKFSIPTPSFLCIHSFAWKWNCWLALKILLFFKQLLSFCFLQASQLSYISYLFKNLLCFFNFLLHIFPYFLYPCIFFSLSLRFFLNKHL